MHTQPLASSCGRTLGGLAARSPSHRSSSRCQLASSMLATKIDESSLDAVPAEALDDDL